MGVARSGAFLFELGWEAGGVGGGWALGGMRLVLGKFFWGECCDKLTEWR